MRALAGFVCLSLVAGWYLLSWRGKLQEMSRLDGERRAVRGALDQASSSEAEGAALAEKLAVLTQGLAAEAETHGLRPDAPFESLQPALEREWEPLTRRPGLSVRWLSLKALEPFALVELAAEGPRDEVFRWLDGLLAAARPCRPEALRLTCDANRAEAELALQVYRR